MAKGLRSCRDGTDLTHWPSGSMDSIRSLEEEVTVQVIIKQEENTQLFEGQLMAFIRKTERLHAGLLRIVLPATVYRL